MSSLSDDNPHSSYHTSIELILIGLATVSSLSIIYFNQSQSAYTSIISYQKIM